MVEKKPDTRSEWEEKCVTLPTLSTDKPVINQWKQVIMEGLKLKYPGDWEKVDWPEFIMKRIESKPAGYKSRKRRRTASEVVRETVEKGLFQLAKTKPSI